jgi:hypothetical protein
MNCRLK